MRGPRSINGRVSLRALIPFAMLALLVLGALEACDYSAGTPPVVIIRQTAAAEAESRPQPPGLDRVTVLVGNAELLLEVASAPEDRRVGLSGRTGLDADAGMLFHFSSGSATGLWMKGMLFGLDFIWVGPDCTVVDLHEGVPAPTGPDDPLPIYRPSDEAMAVIEIAAGGERRGDGRNRDRRRGRGCRRDSAG